MFTNIDRGSVNFLSLGLVKPKSKVLDIGCGDGLLGKIMHSKLDCRVWGVEINPKLAKTAEKRLDGLIAGNVEAPEILKKLSKQGPFEVIFASAILEHLLNPAVTVKNLSKFLKKDGFFIITLPNIGHWSIRFQLFMGMFEYGESGILDRTHLHFYTIKTAKQFILKDCKLSIEKVQFEFNHPPVIHNLFKTIPFFGNLLESKLYNLFPGLFAYQMVFKASRKTNLL